MKEISLLILPLLAGILVGAFFFGGLWWTTKKAVISKSPVFWFLGSLFVRLGVTVTAFYFIAQNRWERMVICLAGFIIARIIVQRMSRIPEIKQNQQKGGLA